MPAVRQYFTTESAGGALVAGFKAPIRIDATNIRPIQEEMEAVVEVKEAQKVVLVCQNILYLYSGFLGELIGLHRRLEEVHGILVLCELRPEIRRIFELTTLDHFFHLADSRQDALQSLRSAS